MNWNQPLDLQRVLGLNQLFGFRRPEEELQRRIEFEPFRLRVEELERRHRELFERHENFRREVEQFRREHGERLHRIEEFQRGREPRFEEERGRGRLPFGEFSTRMSRR